MSEIVPDGTVVFVPTCRWCRQSHGAICPSVKAIEYDADGVTVRRVEFFAPKDYHQIQIVPNALPLPYWRDPLHPYVTTCYGDGDVS